MAVLLIAEVTNGILNADATGKALTAVKQMGDVTVLCAGSGCSAAAAEAAELDGVANVLCASDDAYGHDLAEPLAELIVLLREITPTSQRHRRPRPRTCFPAWRRCLM